MNKDTQSTIVNELLKYINDSSIDSESVEQIFLNLGIEPEDLLPIIWSTLSIFKQAYSSDKLKLERIYQLCGDLGESNPKFYSLFLIAADLPTCAQIFPNKRKNIISFNKEIQKLCSNLVPQKYSFQSSYPEGFAYLYTSLLFPKPPSIQNIIGQYCLDPDSVLTILLDVVGETNNSNFLPLFHSFSFDRLLELLLNRMRNCPKPGLDSIFSDILDSYSLSVDQLWDTLAPLMSHLSILQDELIQATDKFYSQLRVVVSYDLTQPKESQRRPAYIAARTQYNTALFKLTNSPHFRLMNLSKEPHLTRRINILSSFDPAQSSVIASLYTNQLLDQLSSISSKYISTENSNIMNQNDEIKEKISDEFFTKEVINKFLLLHCHCTDTKLFIRVCRLKKVPPQIISYFLLPYCCLSKCRWQLSYELQQVLFRFSINQRKVIYKQFEFAMLKIPQTKLISGSTFRQVRYITKRLSITNAESFGPKFGSVFMEHPPIAAREFINFLGSNKAILDIPLLVCKQLTPISLDILLLNLMNFDNLNSMKLENQWPKYIASIFGSLVADHQEDVDLTGILDALLDLLNENRFEAACFLSSIVYAASSTTYLGLMTKEEFEDRSAEQLLKLLRRLNDDNEELSSRTNYLKPCLAENDRGLKILAAIDKMRAKYTFMPYLNENTSAADLLDHLQFSFITICEFLDPKSLYKKNITFDSIFKGQEIDESQDELEIEYTIDVENDNENQNNEEENNEYEDNQNNENNENENNENEDNQNIENNENENNENENNENENNENENNENVNNENNENENNENENNENVNNENENNENENNENVNNENVNNENVNNENENNENVNNENIEIVQPIHKKIIKHIHYPKSVLTPTKLKKYFNFTQVTAFQIAGTVDDEIDIPEGLSPNLYKCFWLKDASDLFLPTEAFKRGLEKVQRKINELTGDNDGENAKQCQSDMIKFAISDHQKKQQERVYHFREELKEISEDWFINDDVYMKFVQFCIIPRSLYSQFDALYSALFVAALLNYCKSFDDAKFIPAFISKLHWIIASTTYEESQSLGTFFVKVLRFFVDREEEKLYHDMLLTKFELLLQRPELPIQANTLGFMAKVVEEMIFPRFDEHITKIKEMVDEIYENSEKNSNVHLRSKSVRNMIESMLKAKNEVKVEAKPQNEPQQNVVSPSPSIGNNLSNYNGNIPEISHSMPRSQSLAGQELRREARNSRETRVRDYPRDSRESRERESREWEREREAREREAREREREAREREREAREREAREREREAREREREREARERERELRERDARERQRQRELRERELRERELRERELRERELRERELRERELRERDRRARRSEDDRHGYSYHRR